MRHLEKTFIDARKRWGGNGSGSAPAKTDKLRVAAIDLFGELGIKSVLDFGCGSPAWLAGVLPNTVEYTGVDVVSSAVVANATSYMNQRARSFLHLNDETVLPRVDLVFCRDVLAHLSHATALATLQMLKRTGATWLLVSNYYGSGNTSIRDGGFRPLNLTRLPFHFPEPRLVIDEGFEKKSMALWRFDKVLPDTVVSAAPPAPAPAEATAIGSVYVGRTEVAQIEPMRVEELDDAEEPTELRQPTPLSY